MKSLANRLMDLDNLIEHQGQPINKYIRTITLLLDLFQSEKLLGFICNKQVITWANLGQISHHVCQYELKAHLPHVITSTVCT
jgi:hypothetical protein